MPEQAEAGQATAVGGSQAALPHLQSWALKQARGPIVQRVLRLLAFEAVVCTQTLAVEPVCTSRTSEAILKQLFME